MPQKRVSNKQCKLCTHTKGIKGSSQTWIGKRQLQMYHWWVFYIYLYIYISIYICTLARRQRKCPNVSICRLQLAVALEFRQNTSIFCFRRSHVGWLSTNKEQKQLAGDALALDTLATHFSALFIKSWIQIGHNIAAFRVMFSWLIVSKRVCFRNRPENNWSTPIKRSHFVFPFSLS